jgi:hypothetical protein
MTRGAGRHQLDAIQVERTGRLQYQGSQYGSQTSTQHDEAP